MVIADNMFVADVWYSETGHGSNGRSQHTDECLVLRRTCLPEKNLCIGVKVVNNSGIGPRLSREEFLSRWYWNGRTEDMKI